MAKFRTISLPRLCKWMVDDTIDDHDYSLVSLPDFDDVPEITFTLGVHRNFGHPELLTAGVPKAIARKHLHGLMAAIKASTVHSQDVQYWEHLDLSRRFQAYPLPPTWHGLLLSPIEYRLGYVPGPVRVLQFPDASGFFPDDWFYERPDGDRQIDLREVDPPVNRA